MARKALLIGAPTYGLAGVHNDVAAMAGALSTRGFHIAQCLGDDATRAGILAAYERLISSVRPGDAALVYFSGHGGLVRAPGPAAPEILPVNRRFIVPVDYADSGPEDFRGITGVELSVLLARLTERTGNVVAVFDCCHAGTVSRGGLVPKSLPLPAEADLAAHLDRQRAAGLRADLSRPLGNPDAVRVVACAPEGQAFELRDIMGARTMGVLTRALTAALAEAGDLPVSWATLVDRVRRQVQCLVAHQRPDVEGPAGRLLFGVAETDEPGWFPVAVDGPGRARLDGGPLLGVQPGDEFAVRSADGAARIGTVVVDGRTTTASLGTLSLDGGRPDLPVGAGAVRVRSAAPRLAVRLPDGEDQLTAAVASSTFVVRDEPAALVVTRDDAGALTVHDSVGPLHRPRLPGPGTVREVLRDLERVARARALQRLGEEPGQDPGIRVTVEWGRVAGGTPRPVTGPGAAIRTGEPIYLAVRNDGTEPVYVSLVDIGVSARITVLNPGQRSGVRLEPREEYVFGRDDRTGRLTGEAPAWPAGLATGRSRPETVVVLVTTAPQDVTVLEQDGVRHRFVGGPRSALDALLSQAATGTTRDLGAKAPPAQRYVVHTVDFVLVPPE